MNVRAIFLWVMIQTSASLNACTLWAAEQDRRNDCHQEPRLEAGPQAGAENAPRQNWLRLLRSLHCL